MRKGIWGIALVAIVLLMASCSSECEYAYGRIVKRFGG